MKSIRALLLVSFAFVSAASFGSMGCISHTPPPGPAAPNHASGAVASAKLRVAGAAAQPYRDALASKLTEAGLTVVNDGGDLELALDVQVKTDDMVSGDDDDSDPNTVGTEVAQYTATLVVTQKGVNVATLTITPSYGLRKTLGDGSTIGTMMSKDEADTSFRVAALAELVNQFTASAEVAKAAATKK
jgi:hypothetical protein